MPRDSSALTGVRFLAAFHLFLFHIWALGTAYESLKMSALKFFPEWLMRVIGKGYISMPFFYLLSGFILSYLYLRPDGTLSVSPRSFLLSRLSRIYPLHVVVLLGLIPLTISFGLAGSTDPLGSHLLRFGVDVMLIQAWFPRLALSGNFPTWALSTVVHFYWIFPLVAYWSRGTSRRAWGRWLLSLPLISLIPAAIFVALGGRQRFPLMSPVNEFLTRTPLLWVPHFLMGIALTRYCRLSRFESEPARRSRIPWGDLATLLLALVWLVESDDYRYWLRHGALAPLFMVILHDLAIGRGLLAALCKSRPLKFLGEASFALFIWQFPVIILCAWIFRAFEVEMPVLNLLLVVLGCLGISIVSTFYFEKPLSRAIRQRLDPRPLDIERSPR